MSMFRLFSIDCSYIEGGSVYNLIKAGAITEEKGKRILREVLMGLQHLHKRNIIHRYLCILRSP